MADLRTLQPWLQPWAWWIFNYGKTLDGKLVVTSARRDYWKQYRLYMDWMSGKSAIPAAPPGRSKHQLGEAFDLATVGVDPFKDTTLPVLGYWWTYYGGYYGGLNDPVHFGLR